MLRSTAHPPCSAPRRLLAMGIALSVSLGALPEAAASTLIGAAATGAHAETRARTASTSVEEIEPDDPALARSRELYDSGRARFDTFDYEGAVALWTEAYATLPPGADWIRTGLVYNIATAQQLAYDLDLDLGHLRRAVLLLEQYVAAYEAQHEDGPQTRAELAKAHARIEGLQERIERAQDESAPAEPTDEQLDGIVWQPVGATLDPVRLEQNRRLSAADRTTDRILVASTVTLSLGGVLTLVGAGTTAGTTSGDAGARGASYGTLGLGLAGLTAGVALLTVGLKRRRKARRGTLVTAAPTVGPHSAGATFSMRF